VDEHPQFRMWKDRLDQESAKHQAKAERRAAREAEHAAWHAAWITYKSRLTEQHEATVLPKWWNLVGWLIWLTRLHAPGGRD
jgi:hypothetical protein